MQNHLENRVYAGFVVRLVAFMIDSLIAGAIVGIIKLPMAFMPAYGIIKSNFLFNYSMLDVFSYLGVSAYFVVLTYFCHTTPGKFLLGLEVVAKEGRFTFINILYRETVGRFLSSLFCIGYLAVLGTKGHQGFHDMLCDTYVVYKNVMPAPKLQPAVATCETVTAEETSDVTAPPVVPDAANEEKTYKAPTYHDIT